MASMYDYQCVAYTCVCTSPKKLVTHKRPVPFLQSAITALDIAAGNKKATVLECRPGKAIPRRFCQMKG